MRIGVFLLLIVYVGHVDCASCRKRVKQLEKKVKTLKKRVTAIEKGLCSHQDCPPGFVIFKNNCLLFVVTSGEVSTWGQARRQCQERGADLITVNSRRKLKFIGQYIAQHYNKAVEMYTGLIVTEEENATTPFRQAINLHNTNSRPKSIRWVRTNQAIQTDTYYKHNPQPPFVRWSPRKIVGTPNGPKNNGGICVAQSCVTLSLEKRSTTAVKSRFKLEWRYSCCEGVGIGMSLGYICETKRMRYVKCKGK